MSNQKDMIIFLYDKADVEEFNKLKITNINKIFIFSPGIEKFIHFKNNIKIIKIDIHQLVQNQKKTIIVSQNIYSKFKKNIKELENLRRGLREDIYSVFFISLFSFLYIHYNSIDSKNYALIYNNQVQHFNDKKIFLSFFIEKIINKKNQGFFLFLKKKKISFFKKTLICLNNFFLKKGPPSLLVYGKKLSLKISSDKERRILEVIRHSDFNLYHIFLNIINILKIFNKKKHYYFTCYPAEKINIKEIEYLINNIFKDLLDNNFLYLEKHFKEIIVNYCIQQYKSRKSYYNFLSRININKFYTDQLRYDIPTIIADISKEIDFETFLVPHGSMSTPSDEYASFVNKISGRGMIFSPLADKIYAQTKISAHAISFHEHSKKIIRSQPLLYGEKKIKIRKIKSSSDNFNFLHVSSPKSLSKWPWIYEDFNEYVYNLKNLINYFSNQNKHKLTIRFREGPECELETFKKIINVENKYINFSKNKCFIDELLVNDVLISYSSTAIEESLIYNKPIIIYSDYKNYKHINYKFKKNKIIYSNQNSIKNDIRNINISETIDYKINW